MLQALYAPLAEADLADIWEYVAKESISAADRLIDTIMQKCEMLAAHSEMGQARPELAPELRSFSAGSYVILYRPGQDGIRVARVVHAARDVESLF